MKVCFLAALISGAVLYSQTPQPPQTPPAAPASQAPPAAKPAPTTVPEMLKVGTYVRRFSAGLSLTVIGLGLIKDRETSTFTTTPPFDGLFNTKGASRRIGYGITAQIAVTDRFAINGKLFLRPRIAYTMNSDIFEGNDNPVTIADERKHTFRNEDTRARLYELPVTIRYFGKGSH